MLATAIESFGIYGYDEYDRFKKVSKEDPVALAALAVLRLVVKRLYDQHDDGSDDWVGPDSPWDTCGWPRHDCPDFAAIARGVTLRGSSDTNQPPDSARLLIAAMAALLVRAQEGSSRAPYSSKAQLIAKILERFPGVRGLGERTMQDLLAKGDKLLEARLKEKQ